jgi:hypothetical protein
MESTRIQLGPGVVGLVVAGLVVVAGCDEPPATADAGTDAGSTPQDAGPPPQDTGPPAQDTGVDTGIDAGIDAGAPDGGGLVVPDTYTFESRFEPGASSVAYSGQVARQVLLADLRRFMDTLTDPIRSGTYVARDVDGDGTTDTMAQTVRYDIGYWYDARASERVDDPHRLSDPSSPMFVQTTYGELSRTAFLREKVAGQADAATDHRDWSTRFVGFRDASLFRGASIDVSTPHGLLEAIFSTLAANAQDESEGILRRDPGGALLPVHLTADGLHLGQLAEKFMLGALAFQQAADKYLDDEEGDPGVGLLAPNTRSGTNRYTALEHAWDEGYGYFGAPRHASRIALADLVGMSRAFDGDSDGRIDLMSEWLFPTARYAALRDNGSAAGARTSFFAAAERAFRTGRAIIAGAGETLTPDEMAAVRAQRDIAIQNWERALAATAISYLNAVIRHTLAIGTPSYSFAAHAGAWSEMKAFALAFQFHRRSPMLEMEGGEERFVRLHRLLRDAPALADDPPDERRAYVSDLLTARSLLGRAYGFADANLGDAMGVGGW